MKPLAFVLCFVALGSILFAQQDVTKAPICNMCNPQGTLLGDGYYPAPLEIHQVAPFAVKPIEVLTGNNFSGMYKADMEYDTDRPNVFLHADSDTEAREFRVTCQDRTRFLMTNEQGEKYCLALVPKP